MDFSLIEQWIKKNNPASICIEAAHIYLDETPNGQHTTSAKIGAEIFQKLDSNGKAILVTNQLFVDDFHPKTQNVVLEEYIGTLREVGFEPDILTFEKKMELPAKNLLATLKGFVKCKNGNYYLNHGNILVLKDDVPTCCLLDAALYVAKISMFDLAITVLPEEYKKQQKKVFHILRALGYDNPPIINVFFNEKGEIIILV